VWNLAHVESAIWHSMNAFSEERLISRTLSLEILLYLSGERQISRALTGFGLKYSTTQILGILIADTEDKLKKAIIYLQQTFCIELNKKIFDDPETKFNYFVKKIRDEGLESEGLDIDAIEKFLLQKTALLALE